MTSSSQLLAENVRLLYARVRRYSIVGTLIAFVMVVATVLITVYARMGTLSLEGIIDAHRTDAGLWLFETMPFLFALWGLLINSVTVYEASAIISDQTQELRTMSATLKSKIMRNATHDPLTDLPNRVLFFDRLEQAVYNARRDIGKVAVLRLNLPNLKEFADTRGHFGNDRLLQQVAARLRDLVRSRGTLAHCAGDEFAVLLQDAASADDVREFVGKIHGVFDSPFSLEGQVLEVRACVGAAMFPDHGEDSDALIGYAGVAMRAACAECRA
jgi:diguanylate cyclase (GGDEF)-like protein